MNEAGRSGKRPAEPSPRNLARPPALILCVPLEQPAQYCIDAVSYEDQHRLVSWARRAQVVETLADDLRRLLEQLDEAA
jgi:hypothetical protein